MSQNYGLEMTLSPEDLFKQNDGEFNIFTATQDIFSTQNEELTSVQSGVSNYTQVSSYFSPQKNQTRPSLFFQITQPFQNFEVSQNFNTQNEELFQSQVEQELNFLQQNSQIIFNENVETEKSFSEDFLNSQIHENKSPNFEFTQPAPFIDEIKNSCFQDRNLCQSQVDLFESCKSVQSSVPSTIISVN